MVQNLSKLHDHGRQVGEELIMSAVASHAHSAGVRKHGETELGFELWRITHDHQLICNMI